MCNRVVLYAFLHNAVLLYSIDVLCYKYVWLSSNTRSCLFARYSQVPVSNLTLSTSLVLQRNSLVSNFYSSCVLSTMRAEIVLSADIGGTNTRLTLYEVDVPENFTRVELHKVEKYGRF
jgi:hypothetical protein